MKYIFLFLVLVCFSACKKDLESHLVGKWDYLGNEYFIQNSVFVSDTTLTEVRATITFNKDGSGNFSVDGEKSILTWEVNEQDVKLAIQDKDTLTYTSVTDEKDVQSWTYLKEDCSTENTNSFCYKWENNVSLKKLD